MADFADRASHASEGLLADALAKRARERMSAPAESAHECEDCGDEIPEARRKAVPGCVSPKSMITRLTVRSNRAYRNTGNFFTSGGNNNGILWGSEGIEVCFNLMKYAAQRTNETSNQINTRIDYQDVSGKCPTFSTNMWGVTKDVFYYRNTIVGSSISFEYVDGANPETYGGCNFDIKNNVIVSDITSLSGHYFHDGLFYYTGRAVNNPWNAIDNTGNLYATYAQGVVDGDGSLSGAYAQNADTVGWQAVAWGETPEDPTPDPDPEDPTPPPTTSGPILRTGTHLLRVGDSVLRVQ